MTGSSFSIDAISRPLASYGLRRHHGADAADVREQRLGALAVRLPAVDAAAARHADRDRRGEVAGRAVAQARRLGDDLVGGRIEVVGELDLDHRAAGRRRPCRPPRRRCRPRRSARRTRATCRTSPAGPRCSGTRRRSSRRPGRRRRRSWSRSSITSIAERSAWIIVIRCCRPAVGRAPGGERLACSCAGLAHLVVQVRRHVLVDVLEHRRERRRVPVEQRAVALGLLLRRARPRPRAPSASPRAPRRTRRRAPIRCCFSRAIGSPSGKCCQSSAGRYFDGSSEVECGAGAVGDPLDQRRPEVAARALGGPARRRVDGEEVVAVDAQRGDAAADAARREGGRLAAGDRLEGRDRPLVVDDVEDHRRAVDVGEGERGVEVGLGGGAVADPAPRRSGCRP